jgi:hypothetical protein
MGASFYKGDWVGGTSPGDKGIDNRARYLSTPEAR